MNEHQLEGASREFLARVKQQWAELTDDEIRQAEGNLEELAGIIQRKYDDAREVIETRLNELRRETGS